MLTKELRRLICVGLDHPSLYKRSVWRKAEDVMNVLTKNCDLLKATPDKSYKFEINCPVTCEVLDYLVKIYRKSVPFTKELSELREFSTLTNIPLNSSKLLTLYFR